MRVKVITENKAITLEDEINKFIETNDIVVKDIKFQLTCASGVKYAAMIMYIDAH